MVQEVTKTERHKGKKVEGVSCEAYSEHKFAKGNMSWNFRRSSFEATKGNIVMMELAQGGKLGGCQKDSLK